MLQREVIVSVSPHGRNVALVVPSGAFILPTRGARRVALGILAVAEDLDDKNTQGQDGQKA